MTLLDSPRTPRLGLLAIIAAVALAGLLLMSSVAAGARADKREPAFGARVLPALELVSQAGQKGQRPVAVSNAGLLLYKGVSRPLPDVPGALSTVHFRNNNHGDIVGAYVDGFDSSGMPHAHGFLMRGRHFTRIDVPGAVSTTSLGVNDRGEVVGSWVGQDATVNPVTGEREPIHGFLWKRGRYTKFDIPGALNTGAYEIDNHGGIVGNYTDQNRVQHGFVLRNGKVTTIDHPRTPQAPYAPGTRVVGIDDHGRLVGSYADEHGLLHAWKWERGRFTDAEPPGAVGSEASEINNRGQIVGRYLDARPKLISFLYERGRYTRIEATGRCDTAAYGISDRGRILIAAAGTTDGTTCPPQGGNQ
jgi:hypothetical protein